MAEGSWVPAFTSLWKGPKAAKLAAALFTRDDRRHRPALEVQARHAAGGLFLELIGWAMDACESGDLGTVDPADIAKAVGMPFRHADALRRTGEEILEALKVAGFVTNDAAAHVKGWEDGPGKLIARRAYERERKRERRQTAQGRAPSAPDPRTTRALTAHEPRTLSHGTEPPTRAPVHRDNGPVQAQLRPISDALSRGTVDDLAHPVPGESRGEYRDTPPSPLRESRGTGRAAAGRTADRGVDPEAHAAFLLEAAPGPWAAALETFRAQHGTGPLVSWFAGATFERQGEAWRITALNDFAAEWIASRYAAELTAAVGAPVTVVGRRRNIGEPDVLR